jgi:ATP-dependent DNA helicase Q1
MDDACLIQRFSSPHYKQLADLRKLCPRVPILALSATCPPDVLRDLIGILSLPPLTNGTGKPLHCFLHPPPLTVRSFYLFIAAEPRNTVLFTSPLYRGNLHYKVLPKSSDRSCTIRDMVKYILDRHPNETGIVYCLSREVKHLLSFSNAAGVAEALADVPVGREPSRGKAS